MKQPSICVVVPNYNDVAHLPRCLNSILNQTVKADQIVFVDDHSTDQSVKVAREQLNSVENAIIILNANNLGTMGALNEGLKNAKTDYVLFLASNDYLADELIQHAKRSLQEYINPGVWSALVWVADENGRRKYIYPTPIVSFTEKFFDPKQCNRLAIQHGNWFTGPTLIYHRETLQSIGGFDIKSRGLADLLAALTISSIRGAVFCPKPLGIMRKHANGYLYNTLINRDIVEKILFDNEVTGKRIVPFLYSKEFILRTKKRIRFSTLRASNFLIDIGYHPNWVGVEYKALHFLNRIFFRCNKLMTVIAYIILRPFDIMPMLRFRLIAGFLIYLFTLKNRLLSLGKKL